MKLQKKYLELLFKTVKETELKLAEARIRDNFLRNIEPTLKILYDDKLKVIETYCIKNEDKPVVENGSYSFTNENGIEAEKELTVLLNEEVEIVDTSGIRDIIESSNYKPNVGEAEMIDAILGKM